MKRLLAIMKFGEVIHARSRLGKKAISFGAAYCYVLNITQKERFSI